MNCDCGSPMSTDGKGKPYCRDCLIGEHLARGRCVNNHVRTVENIRIRDTGSLTVRCAECVREASRRWYTKTRPTNCSRCGGKLDESGSGKRFCASCSVEFGSRGAAVANAAQAKRIAALKAKYDADREWLDWVVVNRVVDSWGQPPGRDLTQAEWFAVLEKLGDELSNSEIAERARCTTRTVNRHRRAYLEAVA